MERRPTLCLIKLKPYVAVYVSIAVTRNAVTEFIVANRTALCRECFCVIAANSVEGHINWHINIAKAITATGGITDVNVLKAQANSIRSYMMGKVSVVW